MQPGLDASKDLVGKNIGTSTHVFLIEDGLSLADHRYLLFAD